MIPVSLRDAGTLSGIELWTTIVRQRTPVGFAAGTHRSRTVLYVRVITSDAEGWGEAATVDHPVGTDPSTSAGATALGERWIPRIIAASHARGGLCPPSHVVGSLGATSVVDRFAAAALEMAILDAELRRASLPMTRWMGIKSTAIPFGGLVGIPPENDLGQAAARAVQLVEDGATRLRVKIRPGLSATVMESVRSAVGNVPLQADANGGFDLTEDALRELQRLDDLNLVCLEEPIAGRDLTQMAQLVSMLRTPVCLDEVIVNHRAARDAIRYEACHSMCLKPGRLGGIRATLGILE